MPIRPRTGISGLRTASHDQAVHGQLAADVPRADIVRQVALFGAQNRDGWGVGLTILAALANLLHRAIAFWRMRQQAAKLGYP
jgi:hypothetical protein